MSSSKVMKGLQVCLCCISAAWGAASDGLTTLYTFTSKGSGYNPTDVIVGSGGVLYGTTWFGGFTQAGTNCDHGCGVGYSLTLQGNTWNEATLWEFGATSSDGQFPIGIVEGPGGVLYGTTQSGGVSSVGTVFSLTPPQSAGGQWTEAIIWQFGRPGDGKVPMAALAIDSNGVLYGTTSEGGRGEHGVAYSLTPPASSGSPWTEMILWRFGNSGDGKKPNSVLTMGNSGVLYGTTAAGGSSKYGTVFSLTPPKVATGRWHESVLASFTKASGPPNGVAVKDGVLYGATSPVRLGAGGNPAGGIVFSLSPPASHGGAWTQTTLVSLPHHRRYGQDINSPLTISADGDLFGTTTRDGAGGSGTIFKVSPPAAPGGAWEYKTVESLGATLAFPMLNALIDNKGIFFGTCSGCGSTLTGSVFSFQR